MFRRDLWRCFRAEAAFAKSEPYEFELTGSLRYTTIIELAEELARRNIPQARDFAVR